MDEQVESSLLLCELTLACGTDGSCYGRLTSLHRLFSDAVCSKDAVCESVWMLEPVS